MVRTKQRSLFIFVPWILDSSYVIVVGRNVRNILIILINVIGFLTAVSISRRKHDVLIYCSSTSTGALALIVLCSAIHNALIPQISLIPLLVMAHAVPDVSHKINDTLSTTALSAKSVFPSYPHINKQFCIPPPTVTLEALSVPCTYIT